MTVDAAPVLSEQIIALVRDDFGDSELGTALWLLRECEDDDERMSVLLDADGDLTTLVLAIEDQTQLRGSGTGR
jgi:hypothetical protein